MPPAGAEALGHEQPWRLLSQVKSVRARYGRHNLTRAHGQGTGTAAPPETVLRCAVAVGRRGVVAGFEG
jgi:hypothetical protein